MEMMGLDSDCLRSGKLCPPGFRFHPTDEELVLFYLKRKICGKRYGLDVISETDVYKWDPEEFPGISKLKTGDRQWFFFSPRDRKYPNGGRCNRATRHGYWKATGRDRTIKCHTRSVGNKKTLVFYRGRAPGGERTNWVMHEYTLDEEEVKRCPPPVDYFALYKAFKKSGSGPKNGEQYGALFREEDWEEEENVHVQRLVERDQNATTFGDPQKSLLDDLEEIMNQLGDEELPVEPCGVDFGVAAEQITGREVIQSTLIDDLLKDVTLPTGEPHGQTTFVRAGFGLEESQTQVSDAREVASVLNMNQIDHSVPDENFFEDFLEMDDLNGPEPTGQNFDEPWHGLEKVQFDDFTEFDLLYEDDSEFVRDVGLGECAEISQRCVNNLENEFTSPILSVYTNDDYGAVNYPLNPHVNSSNATIPQLWTDEQQRCRFFTDSEANPGFFPPPTTGVIHQNRNNSLDPHSLETNENGGNERDRSTDSWLSSALWDFVESIPTTPASASDSVLVNRAFERMSSFSRVRSSARNTNLAVACSLSSTPRGSGKGRSRFMCFFLVGILCAVVWALVGTFSVAVMS